MVYSSPRPVRLAAQRAEDYVGAIAKQEEVTRNELYDIAQYEERSAHISRVPHKFVSWKLNSERGLELLEAIAREDPESARPVAPFTIIRFKRDDVKQKFQEYVSRPIVIESDDEEEEPEEVEVGVSLASRAAYHLGNNVDSNGDVSMTEPLSVKDPFPPSITSTPLKRQQHRRDTIRRPRISDQQRLGRYVPPGGRVRHHPPTEQILRVLETISRCNPTPPENSNEKTLSGLELDQQTSAAPLQIEDVLTPPQDEQEVHGDGEEEQNLTDKHEPQDIVTAQSVTVAAKTGQTCDQASLLNMLHVAPVVPAAENDDCEPVSNFSNFMTLPPRNLQEHVSYRVGKHLDKRLMKYQQPPNGWQGCIEPLYRTDFSDPRFWSAPSKEEQHEIWKALAPTIEEYSRVTKERCPRESLVSLPFGYNATYTEIQYRFAQWCFTGLGFGHNWIVGGKVNHRLFRLERWYGLLADYIYAPNWPYRVRNSHGKIVQNPDCFACSECLRLDIFCHGHREDFKARCTPCVASARPCSKTLV